MLFDAIAQINPQRTIKSLKKISLYILILVTAICMAACKTTTGYEETMSFVAFGTFIDVTLRFDSDTESVRRAAGDAFVEMKAMLDEIEECLSADNENGDVARFNSAAVGEKICIRDLTAECFSIALTLHESTDGAYNPAVYNLVDLWGFSSRRWSGASNLVYPYDGDYASLPRQEYIDAFVTLTDFNNIGFGEDGGGFYLIKPATTAIVDDVEYTVKIDLGGICKGFATDKLRSVADKYGADGGSVVSGMSSITYIGDDVGDAVDLANPDDGLVLLTKNNVNGSISVSGDYQRYFTVDGKKYCHIIDVNTGYPTDSGARTVFAECDSAAVCDGVTTALMTMDAIKIASFADGEAAKALGVYSVIAVFGNDNNLDVYTNSPDVKIKSSAANRYTFATNGGDVTFTKKNNYDWLWGVAVAVAVAATIIALAVKNGKSDVRFQPVDFKALKFFKPLDVLFYVAVAVIIVGIFIGAGAAFDEDGWRRTEVWCEGVLVCYFDNESNNLVTLSNDWANRLVCEKKGDLTVLTIYVDDEKTEFNTITFQAEKVTMTDSSCRGRDCVKTANTVTRANQIVICMPHSLKIIGVGDGNMEVR